jgi:hypothetical protein
MGQEEPFQMQTLSDREAPIAADREPASTQPNDPIAVIRISAEASGAPESLIVVAFSS